MSGWLIWAVLAVALGLMAYIRLAPSDPAVWNVAISDGTEAVPGPCANQIRTQRNGARVVCLLPGEPAAVLAKLAAIAATYPRTAALAGMPQVGRMTWVTRSNLMGYPDYLTAETTAAPGGTRLEIYARQRFGGSDLGVNAARLKVWLTALDQP